LKAEGLGNFIFFSKYNIVLLKCIYM
jgi:hypothetical protein